MVKGILLVLLGACSFGILSTFVKLAYADGYHLGDVTGTQAFFGALMLWALCFFSRKKIRKKAPAPHTHWAWLMLAGCSTGLVSVLYYQCVKLIPASMAIILLMQFVWISMLLELLIFKKRPTLLQLLAVVLLIPSTLLASGYFQSEQNELNPQGLLYGLLAAFTYALFLLLNGRLGNDHHPLRKSALMISGACLLIFILFPPFFLINGTLGGSLLKWGLVLAAFGTVIPPLCFASGIPKIGLTLSAILSAAELPVAVLMSSLVLLEPVGLDRWTGVCIILFAVILPNLENLKKPNIFKQT